MSANLADIRDAMRAVLEDIPGLHAYAYMPNSPSLPAAAVFLRSFDYAQTMGADMTRWRFVVWVYVNAADLMRAQASIDEYLAPEGERSVKQALEADQHLGGIAQWVKVIGITEGSRLVDAGGVQPLALPIDVEVMA